MPRWRCSWWIWGKGFPTIRGIETVSRRAFLHRCVHFCTSISAWWAPVWDPFWKKNPEKGLKKENPHFFEDFFLWHASCLWIGRASGKITRLLDPQMTQINADKKSWQAHQEGLPDYWGIGMSARLWHRDYPLTGVLKLFLDKWKFEHYFLNQKLKPRKKVT